MSLNYIQIIHNARYIHRDNIKWFAWFVRISWLSTIWRPMTFQDLFLDVSYLVYVGRAYAVSGVKIIDVNDWKLRYFILDIHTNKTPYSHRTNITNPNNNSMYHQRNNIQTILILIHPIHNYNRRDISTIYIHNKTGIKWNIFPIK